MKHMILVAMILLAVSATTATALDAPAMWMEQNDDTITLMVNTSETASAINAYINFDPAFINITDVDFTGSPWQPLSGPGWSHQGNHIILVLTDFAGVAAGEYQIASMAVDCIEFGTSQVTITNAEPANVAVSALTYVCSDDTPVDDDAMISIGNGEGDVTLPITVSGAGNAGAVDITLTYDPAVVNVTGVEAGGMDCTYINDENSGWVRIGATQGSNPGLADF